MSKILSSIATIVLIAAAIACKAPNQLADQSSNATSPPLDPPATVSSPPETVTAEPTATPSPLPISLPAYCAIPSWGVTLLINRPDGLWATHLEGGNTAEYQASRLGERADSLWSGSNWLAYVRNSIIHLLDGHTLTESFAIALSAGDQVSGMAWQAQTGWLAYAISSPDSASAGIWLHSPQKGSRNQVSLPDFDPARQSISHLLWQPESISADKDGFTGDALLFSVMPKDPSGPVQSYRLSTNNGTVIPFGPQGYLPISWFQNGLLVKGPLSPDVPTSTTLLMLDSNGESVTPLFPPTLQAMEADNYFSEDRGEIWAISALHNTRGLRHLWKGQTANLIWQRLTQDDTVDEVQPAWIAHGNAVLYLRRLPTSEMGDLMILSADGSLTPQVLIGEVWSYVMID